MSRNLQEQSIPAIQETVLSKTGTIMLKKSVFCLLLIFGICFEIFESHSSLGQEAPFVPMSAQARSETRVLPKNSLSKQYSAEPSIANDHLSQAALFQTEPILTASPNSSTPSAGAIWSTFLTGRRSEEIFQWHVDQKKAFMIQNNVPLESISRSAPPRSFLQPRNATPVSQAVSSNRYVHQGRLSSPDVFPQNQNNPSQDPALKIAQTQTSLPTLPQKGWRNFEQEQKSRQTKFPQNAQNQQSSYLALTHQTPRFTQNTQSFHVSHSSVPPFSLPLQNNLAVSTVSPVESSPVESPAATNSNILAQLLTGKRAGEDAYAPSSQENRERHFLLAHRSSDRFSAPSSSLDSTRLASAPIPPHKARNPLAAGSTSPLFDDSSIAVHSRISSKSWATEQTPPSAAPLNLLSGASTPSDTTHSFSTNNLPIASHPLNANQTSSFEQELAQEYVSVLVPKDSPLLKEFPVVNLTESASTSLHPSSTSLTSAWPPANSLYSSPLKNHLYGWQENVYLKNDSKASDLVSDLNATNAAPPMIQREFADDDFPGQYSGKATRESLASTAAIPGSVPRFESADHVIQRPNASAQSIRPVSGTVSKEMHPKITKIPDFQAKLETSQAALPLPISAEYLESVPQTDHKIPTFHDTSDALPNALSNSPDPALPNDDAAKSAEAAKQRPTLTKPSKMKVLSPQGDFSPSGSSQSSKTKGDKIPEMTPLP